MAVYIENQSGSKFNFHYKVLIEKAVETVMKDKNIPSQLDVSIIIVDSDRIRKINHDNRNMDSATDVLSFPYFEFEEPGYFDSDQYHWIHGDILGDIVLCSDKIFAQAQEYGHSVKREMIFLVVHSMLHLIGYDHIEAEDAEVMESEQRRIMDILGIDR